MYHEPSGALVIGWSRDHWDLDGGSMKIIELN